MSNEIIIYQADKHSLKIEVNIYDETVWLTQTQIVELFNSSKANISEHIKHIFQSGELIENASVRKFRTVRKEGNRHVNRELTHYSLDIIISVGYRVNSIRGTQFRVWANSILKDHLLKGYSVNKRMNRIEDKVDELSQKVNKMDFEIHTSLPPKQGIFFDGQIFDAYTFVASIIKQAKSSIIVIDNYIDESVLMMLSKRSKNVNAAVYTKPNKQLELDVKKHNQQYEKIDINPLSKSHDRFIIIDKKDIYHLGASLKDLGKKWFAFSKMEIEAKIILQECE